MLHVKYGNDYANRIKNMNIRKKVNVKKRKFHCCRILELLYKYALSLMVKALVILDNKMQASIIIFRAIAVMGEVGLLK